MLSFVAMIHAYVLFPLLSLGSSTVRSNPLPGTSSHCKTNRSSWPNKTEISEKKYEATSNHAYKNSGKIQIIIIDKLIIIHNSSDLDKHIAKEYYIR